MKDIIIVVGVIVLLFFVFRELNNWYWKINERLTAHHKTNSLLEKISNQLASTDTEKKGNMDSGQK